MEANKVSTPKGRGFDFPLEGDFVTVLVRRARARERKQPAKNSFNDLSSLLRSNHPQRELGSLKSSTFTSTMTNTGTFLAEPILSDHDWAGPHSDPRPEDVVLRLKK